MSKVSIEINGLKFGLRVSPEIALQLVEALQGVWVAAARHKRGECFLGDVAKARDAAKSVIVSMTVEIFRAARKADELSATGSKTLDVVAQSLRARAGHIEKGEHLK